jgi:TM2 domain-containing membrane protein YozV
MKKVMLLFATTLVLMVNAASAAAIEPSVKEPLFAIGYGVKVTYDQLVTMTPKEYKNLTGHRLGVAKSLVLKLVQKKVKKAAAKGGDKSQLVAALLCFFIGVLGIHRFYLGYTWQGVVQLLTLGGLGIWTLIDFIRILLGDLQPKNGEYNPSFDDM